MLIGRLAASGRLRLSEVRYVAVQANPTSPGLLYSVYGAGPSMYYQATSPHARITRVGG